MRIATTRYGWRGRAMLIYALAQKMKKAASHAEADEANATVGQGCSYPPETLRSAG